MQCSDCSHHTCQVYQCSEGVVVSELQAAAEVEGLQPADAAQRVESRPRNGLRTSTPRMSSSPCMSDSCSGEEGLQPADAAQRVESRLTAQQ